MGTQRPAPANRGRLPRRRRFHRRRDPCVQGWWRGVGDRCRSRLSSGSSHSAARGSEGSRTSSGRWPRPPRRPFDAQALTDPTGCRRPGPGDHGRAAIHEHERDRSWRDPSAASPQPTDHAIGRRGGPRRWSVFILLARVTKLVSALTLRHPLRSARDAGPPSATSRYPAHAGEVAERLKAALLKSVELQDSVGSNPTLSASRLTARTGSLRLHPYSADHHEERAVIGTSTRRTSTQRSGGWCEPERRRQGMDPGASGPNAKRCEPQAPVGSGAERQRYRAAPIGRG